MSSNKNNLLKMNCANCVKDCHLQPKTTLATNQQYEICDSPINSLEGVSLSNLFDHLVILMENDQNLRDLYNRLQKLWYKDPLNQEHYAGFFKNYFRNREEETGYDDKVVWQMSGNFLEQLRFCLVFSNYRHQPVADLVTLMSSMLERGIELMKPTIEELCLE